MATTHAPCVLSLIPILPSYPGKGKSRDKSRDRMRSRSRERKNRDRKRGVVKAEVTFLA
jgi:hypothetical protein